MIGSGPDETLGRLAAALRLEVRHQVRQGFYAATGVILVVWAGFLAALPEGAGVLVPAFLLTNITITAFFFSGGLVLLERDQGVLPALGVSPLRPMEYVLARGASLALIVVVEGLAIVAMSWALGLLGPPSARWLWFLVATLLGAAILVPPGIAIMARYGSVNEALMPASLAATILEWPALVVFGIPEWPVYYLIPTQAPWLLMRAGLEPIAPWQVAYAFAASAIWLAVAGRLALGAYRRLGMG